jgi:hypothetical protein
VIHLPPDSILHDWISAFDNTEIFHSWRIATGLAVLGAACGRNIWFPYGNAGTIWPNTSVLLVGGSGKGKDTINAPATNVLAEAGVKYVAGKTMESVYLSLHRLGDPAVGYIFAGELKEFLGSKDYQSGILEGITNILSNNQKVDITTKQDLLLGNPRFIRNPTLTMFAGSTITWLQKIDGIMDSGFLPRFIVAVELGDKEKFIPNHGRYESIAERKRITEAKINFQVKINELKNRYETSPAPFTEDLDGEYYFTNWYANRHLYFPPTLEAYAERSGNLMRKIAMLMAVSRGHHYIEAQDYEFASAFMIHGAIRLETAVVPTRLEVTCSKDILTILPTRMIMILRAFSPKYGPRLVKESVLYLTETGQIVTTKEGIIMLKETNG